MTGSFQKDTQESYDKVAAAYAQRFEHELSQKPFDRKILELLAEKVGQRGTICDMGCGPGQVAAYLHQLGAQVCGIDLSPQMVIEAQRLFPDIPFQQGDMLALRDLTVGTFAGIAAFYSIIHIPREHLVTALREMRRVLCEDGVLLLTFHIGDEVRHLDSWFDQSVNVDFAFFQTAEMKSALQSAGFDLLEVIERDPYPADVEVQTRRAYLFARKPPTR